MAAGCESCPTQSRDQKEHKKFLAAIVELPEIIEGESGNNQGGEDDEALQKYACSVRVEHWLQAVGGDPGSNAEGKQCGDMGCCSEDKSTGKTSGESDDEQEDYGARTERNQGENCLKIDYIHCRVSGYLLGETVANSLETEGAVSVM